MQSSEAREITKNWENQRKKNPNLECSHPHREKEYYLGTATGDHICTTCGDAKYK